MLQTPIDGGLSAGNKGWYATEADLLIAYPTGENGWVATIGTTDTLWTWDSDTNTWVNTGVLVNGGLVGSREVDETNIADDYILVYNQATGKLEYETKPTGGGGGSSPIFETQIAGEQVVGQVARFVSKGVQTIAGVKISLSTLPTGANFSVQVYKNGIASTDSIFTSDTPISITTGQGATNGIYISTATAIDNGSLVENDVLYFYVTVIGSTLSGTNLQVLVY